MTDTKKKRDLRHTPRGVVAGFTAIQKAATNFVPEGKFETALAFEADAVADLIEELEAIRDAEFEEIKQRNPKLKKVLQKADVAKPELDDEGDETGRVILKFGQKAVITMKSGDTFKKTIQFVDGRGKRITKPVKVGNGSVAKVSFEPAAYFGAKDKIVGITLRFVGFQLIKLVEYAGGSGGPSNEEMGFEDETEGDEDAFDSSAYSSDDDDDDQDTGGSDDLDDEVPF